LNFQSKVETEQVGNGREDSRNQMNTPEESPLLARNPNDLSDAELDRWLTDKQILELRISLRIGRDTYEQALWGDETALDECRRILLLYKKKTFGEQHR
jgi:hypothetical protein